MKSNPLIRLFLWCIALGAILLGLPEASEAGRPTILPFDVIIGGQKAKAVNAIYATLAQPVSADAEIEVEGQPAMLILNIFKSNAKGEVANGVAPAVILVNNSNKTRLDATMDKKKLEPGIYLANVVQTEKGTSRVLFTVK